MRTVFGVRAEAVDVVTTFGARGAAVLIKVIVVRVRSEEKMTTIVVGVRAEAVVLQFVTEDVLNEQILNLKY